MRVAGGTALVGWAAVAVTMLALTTALVALALTAPTAQATNPGENGRIYFTARCEVCGQFDVYSINPDGSGLDNVTDVVTSGPDLPDSAYEPSVSADGKRMAFTVDSQATSEIWIMNTDGSGARQLTKDNLLDWQPAISPDGLHVVWTQYSPFPEYTVHDIWAMNSDGSAQQLFYDGGQEDRSAQFTPDGRTIVMESEVGDTDIRKVPFTPMVPPLSTSIGVADDDNFLETEPTVSPDGTRVIFTRRPTVGPIAFDLYSVSINGGPTALLFSAVSTSGPSPAYSPDGTKVVFNSNGKFMLGNADGSGTPAPLDLGTVNSPSGFDWVPKPAASPPPPPPPDDKDPPETKILKGPKGKIRAHRVKFRFSSDEPGSTFSCKLDRRKFSRCSSPKSYRKLKAGKHVFKVFATDSAGNRDPSPAKRAFRILKAKKAKGKHHAR